MRSMGYKKESGITSFSELNGKHVEGELFSGRLYIHRILAEDPIPTA